MAEKSIEVIPEAAPKSDLPDFGILSASRQQPTCVRLSGIQKHRRFWIPGLASLARDDYKYL